MTDYKPPLIMSVLNPVYDSIIWIANQPIGPIKVIASTLTLQRIPIMNEKTDIIIEKTNKTEEVKLSEPVSIYADISKTKLFAVSGKNISNEDSEKLNANLWSAKYILIILLMIVFGIIIPIWLIFCGIATFIYLVRGRRKRPWGFVIMDIASGPIFVGMQLVKLILWRYY